MFIAWAAKKADISDYVGEFAWTPSHAVWFIEQDAWTQRPEPGALVFFDWRGGKSYKGVDHVGIVERVEGKKIHTIEANVDRVWLKRKTRETDKVVGYGLPRVVKANAALNEVRATERPFPLGERADVPGGSPLDLLGSPLALLAVIIVTTVVVSFRVAGRRRAVWPWNAPPAPPAAPSRLTRVGTGPRPGPHPGTTRPDPTGSPAVPDNTPDHAPDSAAGRAPGAVATRARAPAGAAPASAPARRRPYEPRE